jgi:hypothetical protein
MKELDMSETSFHCRRLISAAAITLIAVSTLGQPADSRQQEPSPKAKAATAVPPKARIESQTTNHVAKFDTSPPALADSVINDNGGHVWIGSASGSNVGIVPFEVVVGAASAVYFQDYSGIVKVQGADPALSTGKDIVLQPDANNVGIGRAPSNYKLDVAGQIHATGAITSDGGISSVFQDVAEWVPSSKALSAGTVVVVDPDQQNHVIASSTAYDTTVAGVVSARPGISLGKAGADKAQIATTGRVKVKADASSAPIHLGDLLVTSEVAGTAMKSVPIEISGRRFHQPGTIIGKALEPLDSGTGEILVLLSLQ